MEKLNDIQKKFQILNHLQLNITGNELIIHHK